LPVSVSIAPSSNPVCAGTSVTFTPTPVNGGTPSYQWYKNTVAVGTGSTYSYVPVTGDHVYVIMTSSLTCKSGSPATSNTLTMNVFPQLIANFAADNLTPQKNETVTFTDLTTGGATAWNWSFDRPTVVFVNNTNSSSKNPQVQFTDGGLYSVTLLATHLPCSDSEIKSGYLRAGISGLWTGNTSSDWNILSNWDNYLVPDGNTDVVIPPSASFWPVFTGDFMLGTQCRNLLLSGTTSQITITGNIVIQ
jgi:PKD repeat protein